MSTHPSTHLSPQTWLARLGFEGDTFDMGCVFFQNDRNHFPVCPQNTQERGGLESVNVLDARVGNAEGENRAYWPWKEESFQ